MAKYPKIAESMKRLHGADYYVKIGRIGGKYKGPKGFARMPFEKVSAAGRKGGMISKRGHNDR